MHKVEFNRVVLVPDRPLIGMRMRMTLKQNATPELWGSFMPRRKEITNRVGEALFSVQDLAACGGFERFTPDTEFEKWAAVEVEGSEGSAPAGMERLVIRGGHYAVFDHHGPPSEFPKTHRYIFSEWLPRSNYDLDERMHFELLQPGWRADDPEAREEVWIPVRQRT